ncbi:MAG: M28 family peptidase [Bacteroidetes bacterium]|jgi:aminopeptidase YwaD|nr:M28 family peptidase [Bacteroidota bacterium]
MRCKLFFVLIGLLLMALPVQSQDKAYVQKVVKKLAAPGMHGRGYVKNGDARAANFLAKEMKKAGLHFFGEDYFQPYHFSVNSFPGKMEFSVDGNKLKAGSDFVVHPGTKTTHQSFELVWLPDTITQLNSVYQLIDTTALEGKMLVVPEGLKTAYRHGIPGVPALMQTVEKAMWWHVSGSEKPDNKLMLKVKKSSLAAHAKSCKITVEAHFIEKHTTNNVIGFVPGSAVPDSFFVFVAHYDHLGKMGKNTTYPGASDNASGTATVLDLARYYSANPEKAYYSMVFILVSGEEAGLKGSYYFAENPLFSLENIRFVINFDMVGTGSEGLSVVNGKMFPELSEILISINDENQYFGDVRLGGESCNSDHCPFYKQGVPAFFLFTRGPENREYHTLTDTHEKLPFTKYESLFGTITDFVEASESAIFNR